MIKRLSLLWASVMRRSSAYRIVAIYLIFGVVWIAGFNQLVSTGVHDSPTQTTLNLLAGWGFIIVTALFLYWLIRLHTAELRASEEKYRTLVEAADDGIVLTDLQGHHLFANDAYYTSLGYTSADAGNLAAFKAVHPDDASSLQEKMSELLAHGHLTTEYRVRHKNGQWRHHVAKATLIFDAAHCPSSILAIVHDVTERQRVEEQINALAKFPSENPNPVLRVTRAGVVMYANAASALVLKGWNSAIGQPLPSHWLTIIRETLSAGMPREEELIIEGRSLLLSLAPIVSSNYVNVYGQDITERKQAEAQKEAALEAVRESEKRYRLLVDSIPNISLHLFDQAHRFLIAGGEEIAKSGFDKKRVEGHTLAEVYPADVVQLFEPLYDKALRGESSFFEHAYGDFVYHQSVIPVYDQHGDIYAGMTLSQNITERKRHEQVLQQRERHLRTILQTALDGYWLVDTQGQFQDVNEAYCAMSGYTRAELLQMSISDVESAETEAEIAAHIQRIIRQGADRFETLHRRKNGTVIDVEISVNFRPEAGGQFTCFLRDITARKQAEEEIIRLNATLEQRVAERAAELSDLYNNAPCGYHSLDNDGVFVRINDTELKWLGYTRAELIGKMKATDILTPASVETFKINFPIFKARGWLRNLELEMVRKDSTVLPILLSATVVTDRAGRFLMSRSTTIDHTERQRAESQREAALAALQQSQARLETANQELEAFAYSISHDLRAPLRAIDGFSRIILEDYAQQLDDEAQRMFDIVRSNTQKMDQLITDLLALSRVSRSQLATTQFDMTPLVHEVYSTIASPDDLQNCTLMVAPLLEAHGDPALLRQVWGNLLANALKYTRPKAKRHIEVGSTTQGQEQVYYVKDNGVGFNPEYAHKLFGIFQRLHSATAFEGTGVGLAIVQRIVQRHGGRVWAEGQPDQGATFYFSLPSSEAKNER